MIVNNILQTSPFPGTVCQNPFNMVHKKDTLISFWPRTHRDNYGRYFFPFVDIHKGETWYRWSDSRLLRFCLQLSVLSVAKRQLDYCT